jgi:hypothetical protein
MIVDLICEKKKKKKLFSGLIQIIDFNWSQ